MTAFLLARLLLVKSASIKCNTKDREGRPGSQILIFTVLLLFMRSSTTFTVCSSP